MALNLLLQKRYDEAEPILLKGYEGMKQAEKVDFDGKRRTAEGGQWIIRLYQAINQPEKARAWREKPSR
jgi:hypothetical protein